MQKMYPVPGCVVERVFSEATRSTVVRVRATSNEACCPTCHTLSSATHGKYTRRPAGLPSLGRRVRLEIIVRRFYCSETSCSRRTFAERLMGLLDVRARRTRRLAAAQRAVAIGVGAEAGARLTEKLAMPVSPETLLRLIRSAVLPRRRTPWALGVDDWALRRGCSYGTILVDLEARRFVNLLPDRTSSTLAHWLRPRSSVEVIARDRSTEYARCDSCATAAIQVADRWHLLRNAREMAERWLTSVHPRLRRLPPLPGSPVAEVAPTRGAEIRAVPERRDRAFPKTAAERRLSAASTARRRALYEEVRRRHAAGEPIMRISRTLGIGHGTVRKYAHAAEFPERAPHRRQRSILDSYLTHLLARHAVGCENAEQLWREIRVGYSGTQKQVRRWLQERRQHPAPTTPHQYRQYRPELTEGRTHAASAAQTSTAPLLPSPTQLSWLLIRPLESLSEADA